MMDVRVLVGSPSPRRNVLHLGEDMELPQEERGLRLGEEVRAAKRQKNRTKAEMTKKHTTQGLRVRRGEARFPFHYRNSKKP